MELCLPWPRPPFVISYRHASLVPAQDIHRRTDMGHHGHCGIQHQLDAGMVYRPVLPASRILTALDVEIEQQGN